MFSYCVKLYVKFIVEYEVVEVYSKPAGTNYEPHFVREYVNIKSKSPVLEIRES